MQDHITPNRYRTFQRYEREALQRYRTARTRVLRDLRALRADFRAGRVSENAYLIGAEDLVFDALDSRGALRIASDRVRLWRGRVRTGEAWSERGLEAVRSANRR